MQKTISKQAEKFAQMGLEQEVIKYLIWMKIKQEIAQRKKH